MFILTSISFPKWILSLRGKEKLIYRPQKWSPRDVKQIVKNPCCLFHMQPNRPNPLKPVMSGRKKWGKEGAVQSSQTGERSNLRRPPEEEGGLSLDKTWPTGLPTSLRPRVVPAPILLPHLWQKVRRAVLSKWELRFGMLLNLAFLQRFLEKFCFRLSAQKFGDYFVNLTNSTAFSPLKLTLFRIDQQALRQGPQQ